MINQLVHRKVTFNGETYWLHSAFGGYNLSPLNHYDDGGELLANPFSDISYAVIINNEIMRYGAVIGTIDDLKDVPDDQQSNNCIGQNTSNR